MCVKTMPLEFLLFHQVIKPFLKLQGNDNLVFYLETTILCIFNDNPKFSI